jgi:hypothetical protein
MKGGRFRLGMAVSYIAEAGFILTHVDMVKETGSLVAGVLKVVDSLEQHGIIRVIRVTYLPWMLQFSPSSSGSLGIRH